jgi:hypothetical protein
MPLAKVDFSTERWEQVSMDFVCGLPVSAGGWNRVLVVCDRGLSKMAHFIACKNTYDATQCAQLYIDHVYKHHGIPQSLISDQDPIFMSNFYTSFMNKLGVRMKPTAAYHPQWDGQTEVTNRTLNTYLSIFCQEHPKKWPDFLALAEFEFNSSLKPTGYSPFYVCTGVNPRTISDVMLPEISRVPAVQNMCDNYQLIAAHAKQALDKAHEAAAVQHNKHVRNLQLKVGDQVMLSTLHLSVPKPGGCKKFVQPFLGPFTILEIKSSGNSFKLDLPAAWRATRTWNGQFIKPYKPCTSSALCSPELFLDVPVGDDSFEVQSDVASSINHPPPMQTFENISVHDGAGKYDRVVDRIVNSKAKRGSKPAQYLLSFQGFGNDEHMWVDRELAGEYSGFAVALQNYTNHDLRSSTCMGIFICSAFCSSSISLI